MLLKGYKKKFGKFWVGFERTVAKHIIFVQILILLFFFILYFVRCLQFLDPDFGWHLRMGEIILEKGRVPATDQFSYTMPSFPHTDSEWLSGVLIALLFHFRDVGYILPSLFFAALAVSPLVLFFFYFKKATFLPMLILVGGGLMGFMGVRPQIFAWFFLSIISIFISNTKIHEKYKLLLPLLFVVWANLHGGFAFGLGIYVIFVVAQAVISRSISLSNLFVVLLSFLVSCINPYGILIWREVFMTFFNPTLRYAVVEWLPSFFFFDLPMWIYFTVSSYMILRSVRKLFGAYFIAWCVVWVMALSSIRHMPLYMFFSLPLVLSSFSILESEAKNTLYGVQRLKKVFAGFVILAALAFLGYFFVFIMSSENVIVYPEDAVAYLKKNRTDGQIFSTYTWGGYLIWKLPEKKVFVDGRMPPFNWKASNESESDFALGEYLGIMSGEKPFSEAVGKYNITTVLVSADDKDNSYSSLAQMIKVFFGSGAPSRKGFLEQVKESHFRLVYKDDVASIYQAEKIKRKEN